MELNRQDLNWCVRRLPKALRDMMERQGKAMFVAGGFVRACIAQEKVSDIDVFTQSKESAEVLSVEIGKSKTVIKTDNAITVKGYQYPIQFISRWSYMEPVQCVESFDFTIARAAFWYDGVWKSVCDDRFYQDLAAKRLSYCSPQRNEDSGGSILRVLKFYQRGYRIPLDSLGAVTARLLRSVDHDSSLFWTGQNLDGKCPDESEVDAYRAKILTGLLYEVDPNTNLETSAHLPAEQEEVETKTQE